KCRERNYFYDCFYLECFQLEKADCYFCTRTNSLCYPKTSDTTPQYCTTNGMLFNNFYDLDNNCDVQCDCDTDEYVEAVPTGNGTLKTSYTYFWCSLIE